MLAVTALFSAVWFFVAPDMVQEYGDPEVAGWIPFWMVPVSILELVLLGMAVCWPNKVTHGLFYGVALVQLLIGCGLFPR